ncbi:MAG: hypothetical protein R3B06_24440 [Kofleriaceae bacterium]
MDVREEARRLHAMFGDQPAQLLQYLAGQMATVKTYAQVIIGLCGLTITVTGFSGAHMIQSGSLAAALMVAGIALVMVGLVMCIRTITLLRWVSQDLSDDMLTTAAVIIARRNHHQRLVSVGAMFVAAGLACYLAAVSVAALVSGNFAPR